MILKVLFAITALFLSTGIASAHPVVGIVDEKGKTITPSEYESVSPLPNGTFLLQKFNELNIFKSSFSSMLVDNSGKEITLQIPSGFTLVDVILPDTLSPPTTTNDLPEGTILQIHNQHGYALCDLNGELLMPQNNFDRMTYRSEGMFTIPTQGKQEDALLLFDSKTRKTFKLASPVNWHFFNGLIALEERTSGKPIRLMDKTGAITVAGDFQEARWFSYIAPFYTDTAAASYGERNGLIDRNYKWVTKVPYSSFLTPLANNTYAARRSDSDPWVLISAQGIEVAVLPKNISRIVGKFKNLVLVETKKDTPASADRAEKKVFEAYDLTGKKLWAINAQSALYEKNGFYAFCIEPHSHLLSYVTDEGKLIDGPTSGPGETFEPMSAARWIRTFDDGKFSAQDWRDLGTRTTYDGFRSINRIEQFKRFNNEFDLVGMTRLETIKLLGLPADFEKHSEKATYILFGGWCGNSEQGFTLIFENERVKRWRLGFWDDNQEPVSDWVTVNPPHNKPAQ